MKKKSSLKSQPRKRRKLVILDSSSSSDAENNKDVISVESKDNPTLSSSSGPNDTTSNDTNSNDTNSNDSNSNDGLVSLPSDFEEDILPVLSSSDSNFGDIEVDSEEPDDLDSNLSIPESSRSLFCYVCGEEKSVDSFSDAQRRLGKTQGEAKCLLHFYSDQSLAQPDPLDDDDDESEESVLEVSPDQIQRELDDSDHDHSSIIQFGKHWGKTFRWVLRQDPSYCQWCLMQENPSSQLATFQRWLSRIAIVGDASDYSEENGSSRDEDEYDDQ